MVSSRSNAFTVIGLSRREMVLRLSAAGLGIALATRNAAPALAQDELPEGTAFTPLGGAPIADLPEKPFTLQVSRITMEPGALFPNSSFPYPTLAYIEKGTGFICPPGGEGRWIYDADGKLIASGGDEMAFPESAWCYTAPDTMDGLRNDGDEQGSFLAFDFVPTPA